MTVKGLQKMTTTSVDVATNRGLLRFATRGAVAGLGGGVVFGMSMAMMGTLPMVGMLVGRQDPLAGLMVHLIISAIIGASYGVIASRLSYRWLVTSVAGAVYGAVWWVLGALVLMPLLLGMTQMMFLVGSAQWMSLIGHAIYGVVTALLFARLSQQTYLSAGSREGVSA
jgi:uncharacterized membrane protein YagU involved in acid resistance